MCIRDRLVNAITARTRRKDFTSLKTVTFGDETAVRPNRWASVISVVVLFLIWGAFTGSKLSPIHVPGPFQGDTTFTYTAQNAAGATDDATVTVRVHEVGAAVDDPVVEPGDGFAKNDVARIGLYRSKIIPMTANDIGGDEEGYMIIAINGEPIDANQAVQTDNGRISMNARGGMNFVPDRGFQMQPLYLPSPERVVEALIEVSRDGYRNFTLLEHLGWSLFRVLAGFVLGLADWGAARIDRALRADLRAAECGWLDRVTGGWQGAIAERDADLAARLRARIAGRDLDEGGGDRA